MNNKRKAKDAERRRALESPELKTKVISYCEHTTEDILESNVSPQLTPKQWGLAHLVAKVQEFVCLLEGLTHKQLTGLSMKELKAFVEDQLRNAYDLQEGQIELAYPGLIGAADHFFNLQLIDTLWREHVQAMDTLRKSVGLRSYGQKDRLIGYENEGYDMFLEMMTQMRRNVIYSMFMFQPAPATQVAAN